jgi:hypothetical protein
MITKGTFTSRVLSAMALAAGAALLVSSAAANAATLRRSSTTGASSAEGPDPSSMIVGYYDVASPTSDNGSGIGDNLLRLVNPTAANGSVCAFVYVFDNEEEMGECCGCPVSPNGLDQISVANDLTDNWGITSFDEASGVIDIVTGLPNAAIFISSLGLSVPACDPGSASTPIGNLAGWITHNQAVVQESINLTNGSKDVTGTTTSLTEVSLFDEGAADSAESAYLVSTCHFLQANGTHKGQCGCGNVDWGNALPIPFPQSDVD